ncbi:hypothetical protein D3C71_1672470 [compost metagenome]
MSAKRFGAVYFDDTTKDTFQTLMTGQAGMDRTAVISFCNQSNGPGVISLSYTVDAILTVPAQADYIVFYRPIAPYETIELSAIAVEEEARIIVHTDIAGVSVVAHGYQDASI